MRRVLRIVASLYPAWWRRRYGREFAALLEDMPLGSRELLNTLTGAMTMHLHGLSLFPVAGMLGGAIAGGLVVARMPATYASSATVLVTSHESSAKEVDVRAALESALGASSEAHRAAITVELLESDSSRRLLRLTFTDRDPEMARTGADSLTNAIATGANGRAVSTEVLTAPTLPTSPLKPGYAADVMFGAVAGLAAGLMGSVLLALQRRRAGTSSF